MYISDFDESVEKIIEELNTKTSKPLVLYINSMWGSMATSIVLANMIINGSRKVYTYNVGVCYSAAMILFLAWHQRYGYEWCSFMQHPTSVEWNMKYWEIKWQMKEFKYLEDKYKKIIESQCPSLLKYDFTKDVEYFGYEEAKDLWIITN